ncbi:sporulation transcriptional regulator SpoIIID [Clostridium perfringens]|uniref:sporulation transcriptional regulator SpoIIID n=1 Tax=Clostridium perfringens TaxID=1502 RepID=UPI0028E0A73F|nr:sporulation transcriptional regulator SpoIIID [Clostridium perfringens]MDT9336949.1 sporulation transcriptional regulator SpoIIID [Clostridium perfringens]MDT9344705.1 sporulation transcriptional regulator SpoIIID [Clostridium perfringens]MDT9347948.1 sporulation transcriptional regulator SpoIIID [Clostridium perfringens]MDT9353588.1 sporulation transcriptional regulator SpoIIID [Clostridium perfringens]
MKQYIEERVLSVADYIINNKATIREAAKVFGVSPNTVHLDATVRIYKLNPQKAKEVEDVILFNKNQSTFRAVKSRWKKKYK